MSSLPSLNSSTLP